MAVFNSPNMSQDDIAKAGEIFISALYPGGNSRLDEKRYEIYTKITSRKSREQFYLAMLPPTSAAARQHSLRVYHQVITSRFLPLKCYG